MATRIQKILVPVDFSNSSRDAVAYAQGIARVYSAEVSLLHVVPPFNFGFSVAELPGPRHEQVEARNRSAWKALEAFADLAGEVEIRRELREGEAADEIVSRAHDGGFDLIIMPTSGAGPIRRLLRMGSVTTKVLSSAECPVLTGVHLRSPAGGVRIRSVVCAIDLGVATERVLCRGSRLAEDFGADLTIVHAAAGADDASDYFDETWRTMLTERVRERIGELLKSVSKSATVVVESGPAPKVITAASAAAKADLLVLGRGESNDLLGRLRANAYEVIRRSQCAVMSV